MLRPFSCARVCLRPSLSVAIACAWIGGCGDSGGASGASTTTVATTTTGTSATTEATLTQTSETSATTTAGGSAWASSLEVGIEHGAFLSVWGPSPTEVYAVGGQLGSGVSQGMIFRWDGEQWSEETLPAETPSLNWVSGAGTEIWAVGDGGATLRNEDGVWVRHPSPTSSLLWGTWGSSAEEIWAVGGDGVVDAPTLLRWDGESWEAVELPAIDPDAHGLFKVWGHGAEDVMVVGDRGVTLHYDGAQWTAADTGSIADLISLWGTGGASMLAVGGRSNGRIARWDGAGWEAETLSIPGLNGVWVDSEGVATIVGWQGTIYRLGAGAWTPTPEMSGTSLLLHATFGFDEGPRFAVGGTLQSAPPFVGLILIDP